MSSKEVKLWGGLFEESVTAAVEKFTESISFDKVLYKHNIMGSRAHASMLVHQGLITYGDKDKILEGLGVIEGQIERGEFVWRTNREDVHMNIEIAVTDLVGEPAKKLHTARSRNDQVCTDFRLWCRDAVDAIVSRIGNLQVVFSSDCRGFVAALSYQYLNFCAPPPGPHEIPPSFFPLRRVVYSEPRVNMMPPGFEPYGSSSANPIPPLERIPEPIPVVFYELRAATQPHEAPPVPVIPVLPPPLEPIDDNAVDEEMMPVGDVANENVVDDYLVEGVNEPYENGVVEPQGDVEGEDQVYENGDVPHENGFANMHEGSDNEDEPYENNGRPYENGVHGPHANGEEEEEKDPSEDGFE